MYAIEIESHVKNGIIHIPERYVGKIKGKVKVIILQEDESPEIKQTNKDKLDSLFKQIKDKQIFSNIKDPVAWQKEIRNEW